MEAGVGPAGRRKVAAGGRPGRRRGAARGAGRARARRARGRRPGSERRRAGRCGPIGDAPRRAAELRRPDLAAPEAGVSERGREPWLCASPPPPLLTRHNPRGARGARRNRWAAARSGRRSCRRRARSVGAEADASTKAGTAPARGGGRRGRPLRARPAPAASLRALPRVPGRRRRRTVLRPRGSGRRSQELHATRSGAPAASFPAARGPAESTRARVPTSTTAGPPARAPRPSPSAEHGECAPGRALRRRHRTAGAALFSSGLRRGHSFDTWPPAAPSAGGRRDARAGRSPRARTSGLGASPGEPRRGRGGCASFGPGRAGAAWLARAWRSRAADGDGGAREAVRLQRRAPRARPLCSRSSSVFRGDCSEFWERLYRHVSFLPRGASAGTRQGLPELQGSIALALGGGTRLRSSQIQVGSGQTSPRREPVGMSLRARSWSPADLECSWYPVLCQSGACLFWSSFLGLVM